MRTAEPRAPRVRSHMTRWLATGMVCLALAGLLLSAVALTGCSGSGQQARQAKGTDQTSFIYDRDGRVIATLHAGENRVDRSIAKVPLDLQHAVVATEDKRFYEHSGVDPMGVLRAIFANASSGTAAQGGSTITQQYVKNAYFSQEKTFSRKVQEAFAAQDLERTHTKDQILELYLNTIYFGHGAYGVEAASQAYFGRGVERLSLAQSALLAGVIRSPGHYSPYLDANAARERRDLVLDLMLEQGYISQQQHDETSAKPVKVAGLKRSEAVAPYFVEYVKESLASQFGAELVYRGGLRVQTTLDLEAQKAAEDAIAGQLDRPDDPSAALVAIEPGTGAIRALVGGRDFASQQFDVATRGKRQPGSAFKPLVLVAALEDGTSPEKKYACRPTTIELPSGPWKVSGSTDGSSRMRLRRATEKSVNAVFAHLIMDVGAEKVVEVAHRLGITSDMTAVPAIALGGHREGVSPLEMANAYATLAAGGKKATPFAVSKVADASGKVYFEAKPVAEQVIDPAVAYLTTDILRGVLRDGTGSAAELDRPAAGKTGTTQEYRDAWFVGYTPDLAASVWVGYPEAQKAMTDVHGIHVTGGSFPARIWHDFADSALQHVPDHEFPRPAGLVERQVCAASGAVANDGCPVTFSGLFLADAVPKTCTLHQEAPKASVPDVVGMSTDDARGELEGAGFRVQVRHVPATGADAGTVVAQNPTGGTEADEGARVTIEVAQDGGASSVGLSAEISGPKRGLVGEALPFDGSGSTGEIDQWQWDFGDGSGSNGPSVNHIFTSPGTHFVTLTVIDANGDTDSATVRVRVREAGQ